MGGRARLSHSMTHAAIHGFIAVLLCRRHAGYAGHNNRAGVEVHVCLSDLMTIIGIGDESALTTSEYSDRPALSPKHGIYLYSCGRA